MTPFEQASRGRPLARLRTQALIDLASVRARAPEGLVQVRDLLHHCMDANST